MAKWPHLFVVLVVVTSNNSVFYAYLFMSICVMVLIPLPRRDDLGMVYVNEYMLLLCM